MAEGALGRDSLIGHTLGHYRLVERIGEGGQAIVYRALDQHLGNREVIVKILKQGALADDTARQRFRKEANALSKLNHPNIATVFDFDCCEGMDYLAEELVQGVSLEQMLKCGALPLAQVVSLGSQLCEGLAAAHENGIIHRDIKPGNLQVSSNAHLKILDFGLAKSLPGTCRTIETATASETQVVQGTLPYISPEQLRNEKLDGRTDIWAAGCVLYEMATGSRPFPGEGISLVDAILHETPTPPAELNHDIPVELQAIILRCLQRDPMSRYASSREISAALKQFFNGRADGDSPVRPDRRTHRFQLVLDLAVFVVAVLLPVVAARHWSVKRPTPTVAVLRFVDMSPAKDEQYFSEGLAEEVIDALAKVPGLRVTARASSFQFDGEKEDLRSVGEKLKVKTILEGSVRKDTNRLRVAVQLINVEDGFHLWSETYERNEGDVFSVQEDIARSVAETLQTRLLAANVSSPRAPNSGAYDAYLQARYFQQRGTKDSLEKALEYYNQALSLDSQFAPAWAGLGDCYLRLANSHAAIPVAVASIHARDAAQRSLVLDPTLADGYVLLGDIKKVVDWDWAGADESFHHALSLQPGNVAAVTGSSLIAATLNRCDQALTMARSAIDLNPLKGESHLVLAQEALQCSKLAEAEVSARRALDLNPAGVGFHYVLAQILVAQSRTEEAVLEASKETVPVLRSAGMAIGYNANRQKTESDTALGELLSKYQECCGYQIAQVHAFRGEIDQAFEWLDRAYAQHDAGLCGIAGDSLLTRLKSDSRYSAFLRKMNLPFRQI